jgi:hypothetical protein
MPDPIDPLSGAKYALQGRVVTMGAAGVLSDGVVYIDAGEACCIALGRGTHLPAVTWHWFGGKEQNEFPSFWS